MKLLLFTLTLFLVQFTFGQKIYSKSQVDIQPTFSACNNRIDADCFSKKLINELVKELTDFYTTSPKGNYKAIINFTINENGKFSDYKFSGNKKLGEKSIAALKKMTSKIEANKTKVIPAKLKGKAVKMSYSLPVNIMVDA